LCQKENVETQSCTGNPCPCVEGVNCTCNLTNWSQWSQCSLTCGGGQRQRTRQFETNSTANCTPQNLLDTLPCNIGCCPVDGGFTPWSDWSACTKACGSGTRERYRSCTNPRPSGKGKHCQGSAVDREPCNVQKCGK
jgi:hemicentin